MEFNSTMSMIFSTSFNIINETNQYKSEIRMMPGNSDFSDVMRNRFYVGLYSFMFVFCLSSNAMLHLLLVRLLRQRLFKQLTRVLLLIHLVDSGAVIFGLPYHWLKLVFDVDIRTLHVWLCRAHVFVINDFMDLASHSGCCSASLKCPPSFRRFARTPSRAHFRAVGAASASASPLQWPSWCSSRH